MTKAAHWKSERGAELIEMAIALPLLLLVVMGIVDFGFLFQRYLVLTNAAMEGARVAVLPGYSSSDAQSRATAYARAGGVPGTVSATASPVSLPGANGGSWPGVRVVVTYEYRYQYIGPIMSIFGPGSLGSVTLTAQSTVRRQLGS
ncbi:MAG: TadE/TadG family type IV pilus assembly protein [Vicinamibacterales bacterium]